MNRQSRSQRGLNRLAAGLALLAALAALAGFFSPFIESSSGQELSGGQFAESVVRNLPELTRQIQASRSDVVGQWVRLAIAVSVICIPLAAGVAALAAVRNGVAGSSTVGSAVGTGLLGLAPIVGLFVMYATRGGKLGLLSGFWLSAVGLLALLIGVPVLNGRAGQSDEKP